MNLLDRKAAIPKLIGDSNRFLIISGLAGPAKDIGFLTKESANTFLFGGRQDSSSPCAKERVLLKNKIHADRK